MAAWPRFLGPGLLFLIVLALFHPLLLKPDHVLYSDNSDYIAMHLPAKRFLAWSWQETGELPLWTPHSFGGMPFIQDVQVAAFYPPHLALRFVSEANVGPYTSWLVPIHLLIAGLGMLFYARGAGMREMPATIAAIGFMLSGKWLMHVLVGGHSIFAPLAWLPWAVLLLEKSIRSRRPSTAIFAGAAFSMIVLGAHPQITLYAGVFLVLWLLPLAWSEADSQTPPRYSTLGIRKSLPSWVGLGSLALVTALGLSAVQLLPAVDAIPEIGRGQGMSTHEALTGNWTDISNFFGPSLIGEKWESEGGFPVLYFALAMAAPYLGGNLTRMRFAIALFLVVFSLGFAGLFQSLPAFRLFRLPSRMLLLVAFPIAFFAGQTIQAILFDRSLSLAQRRRVRAIAMFSLALALILIGRTALASRNAYYVLQPGLYWLWLLPAMAVLIFLLRPRTKPASRPLIAAWICLLLLDSWTIVHAFVRVKDQDELYRPSACAQLLAKAHTQVGHSRFLDRYHDGRAPIGPALPFLGSLRLEPVFGYNSFNLRRYCQLLSPVLDETSRNLTKPAVDPDWARTLDLLGVRYVLTSRAEGWTPDMVPKHWKLIGRDMHPRSYSWISGGVSGLPPYDIYENTRALQRCFLLATINDLDLDSSSRAASAEPDVNVLALSGEGTNAVSVPTSLKDTGGNGSAVIAEYQPNRVSVRVAARGNCFLVLMDPWHPGWRAEVDGSPAEILVAGKAFRGIALGRGDHEVTLQFLPQSYLLGRQVSVCAMILFASTGMLSWRRGAWAGT